MEITQDLDAIDAEPFHPLWSADAFDPSTEEGITKYRADVGRGCTLDSLFVNKKSDVLLVSMHGALQRAKIQLPRFERLRSFLRTEHSSIYFGDPSLYLSESVSLSWFTGSHGMNAPLQIADWVQRASYASGASKVIFVGSSGGGFASAQVASYVPGSVAVVFNPQTVISAYRPNGSLGYGRNYIRHIMPELTPEGGLAALDADTDWSAPMRDRGSMIVRYSRPAPNKLFFVQNSMDHSHWRDHYTPFREATEGGVNHERIRYEIYTGPEGHSAPPREIFDAALDSALAWLDEEGVER